MDPNFDQERLRQLLSGQRWGQSLDLKEVTASTMDDAAKAAAAGAPDGHVVLADRQTRGRGAHGREWVSPAGTDLYFSIVARPGAEASVASLITLAVGLGVRNAVTRWVPGRAVMVKWPNDVWVEGKKCAGILVETRTVGNNLDSVIIGVGMNVNRDQWPVELAGTATSIRTERDDRRPVDRETVFADALLQIERSVRRFVTDGPPAIVRSLKPHLALVGDRVRWEEGSGVFLGIDLDGAARVQTESGPVSLRSARFEPLDTDSDPLA